MTPTPEVPERIRRYLLGQLDENAHEEVEKGFLTSDEMFGELLVVEDEIIDDYLAGKLDDGERAAFENHFLATPERHDKLKFGKAFNRYLSSQTTAAPARQLSSSPASRGWTRTLFSSPLRIGVLAIVVVGIVFGVWPIFFHQSEVDKGLVALNAAYREQRPVESRISSLSYAPFPQTRGPGSEARVDSLARDRAELTLNNAVNERGGAAAHHALGDVYLAKKRFDDAIAQFEIALKSDPKNPRLLSDLAAAWLEKGKLDLDKARTNGDSASEGNAVIELGKSLDNINLALKLENKLPEALFNRALYHQYMRLREQEEEDWREYLRQDPNSRWSEEAKRRLDLLEQQRKQRAQSKEERLERFRQAFHAHDDVSAWELVSSCHNRSGNLIVEHLLDDYLSKRDRSQNDEEKDSLLSLQYVGELSQQKAGDRFFTELSRFYAAIKPEQRAALVTARVLMKSAHESWGQATTEQSLNSFNQAKHLFDESGDDYDSLVAAYWVSFSYYRNNNQTASLAILEPLIIRCENSSYLWLLDRLLYLMSSIQFKLNQHSRAIEFGTRAATLAERTNDRVGMVNALGALIEFHRYLGDYQKALSYVSRGFGIVDSITMDPVQAIRHYGFEATAFASAGLFAAASDYAHLALQLAFQSGLSAAVSSNYSLMALINWKLGDYDEAMRNSQLAYETAQAHSGGRDDQNLMAYASLQTAHASRLKGDFNTALLNYDRSIALYDALKLPTHLYQAHKGRLLCYVAQQNDELANREISTAINLVEQYRTEIFEENTRNNFFDSEQSVFDTAIDFQHSRMHNDDLAFWYSEQSRARSLLDLIISDGRVSGAGSDADLVFQSFSRPLSPQEIRAGLPEQVRIVQYVVLEGKLIIFVVSKERVETFTRAITASDLTEKVVAYTSALSRPANVDPQVNEAAAKDLFKILIAPIQASLGDGKELCVVPDKVLNFLPFAALMSDAGRYLVQDFVLEFSPSATIYIKCSEMARQKESVSAETALVVGNPSFDRDEYPSLTDLPSAVREAEEVANLYGQKPVIENAATATLARREMEKSEVIHLALHSILDEHFPLRSKLLFARTMTPAKDSLSAYEVYRMNLSRARLVVLSSCQTGAERYYKGEGMISLVRPFIAARVPLVVSTLWPVESNATAELMIRFHKHRTQEKTSTAAAIAEAQRDMLVRADPQLRQPYYWAAFTLIGGYANF